MSNEEKIQEMKDFISLNYKDEYSLLSTEYKNAREKVIIKHNTCNTIFSMRYDAFFGKQRQQCPNPSCVKKRTEETSLKKFGARNFLAASEGRKRIKAAMKEKYGEDCFFKNGLIQKKMQEKYNISSSNQIHINTEYIKYLSDFSLINKWKQDFILKESREPTIYDFCEDSGYDTTTIYKAFQKNNWNVSNFFFTKISNIELQIKDFLEKNEIAYILHDRKTIKPLELDFFIPSFSVALELNGSASHSSSDSFMSSEPKDKLYHQQKSLLCEQQGIRLIHIFEWDLLPPRKEKTFSFLGNIFHIDNKVIYARKCEIKKINNTIASQFYDKYHLQSHTQKSKYNYGLFFNKDLVSCMTFTKNKETYILARFCSKSNINIVGGASKLFKHFLKECTPKKIVSFSDITKMSGHLYNVLGFCVEKITPPSYWWANRSGEVFWRRECQKQYMHKLPNFDKDYKYLEHKQDKFWQQSETEIMKSKGYTQIFDSGMRKHVWKEKTNDR